jgi:hypothetical protein
MDKVYLPVNENKFKQLNDSIVAITGEPYWVKIEEQGVELDINDDETGRVYFPFPNPTTHPILWDQVKSVLTTETLISPDDESFRIRWKDIDEENNI